MWYEICVGFYEGEWEDFCTGAYGSFYVDSNFIWLKLYQKIGSVTG